MDALCDFLRLDSLQVGSHPARSPAYRMMVGQGKTLLHTGGHIIYIQGGVPAVGPLDGHGGGVINLQAEKGQ